MAIKQKGKQEGKPGKVVCFVSHPETAENSHRGERKNNFEVCEEA